MWSYFNLLSVLTVRCECVDSCRADSYLLPSSVQPHPTCCSHTNGFLHTHRRFVWWRHVCPICWWSQIGREKRCPHWSENSFILFFWFINWNRKTSYVHRPTITMTEDQDSPCLHESQIQNIVHNSFSEIKFWTSLPRWHNLLIGDTFSASFQYVCSTV